MAYIGRQLVRGQNRVLDDISGSFNGSTTAFNLTVSSSSSPPASVNQLWIILGGILQKPGTDFTVADAVITFTTAPASTLSFWGMIQGDTSDINAPADASVTPSKIANSGDFAFPADVRFNDADGSHYVGLQAPSTVSSNLVWTLPAADGSANQVLKTDGSGALGWASDANAPEGTAVLSTGETGTTKYLRVDGDNTCSWQLAVDATKATLTGSTNNTITTVTGANAIQGEANLTFDGTVLRVKNTDNAGDAVVYIEGGETGSAVIEMAADEGDDNADKWKLYSNASNNKFKIANKTSGSYVDKLNLETGGNVEVVGGDLTIGAGSINVSKAEIPTVLIQNSTDTSYSTVKLQQSSGSGGYFALNKLGTNSSATGGANAAQLWQSGNAPIIFGVNNAEKVRFQAGGGISFNGDTAAANALDDYEEGNFAPSFGGSTNNGTISLSAQNGFYVKIGCIVHVWIDVTISSWSGASGTQRITGLPFNKNELASQAYYYEGVTTWYVVDAITNTQSNYGGYMNDNGNHMNMYVGDTPEIGAAAPVNVTGRCSCHWTYSTSS